MFTLSTIALNNRLQQLRSTSNCRLHGFNFLAPSKRRSDPCSYRPISLLCCLSKVFEAIMTKRLMSWAENTGQLPTEQSGFRKHHSTNDKLFELTQAVCQAQRLSKRVGAVFLDIEKAFDRVWHNGLRYTWTRFAAQMDFQLFKG